MNADPEDIAIFLEEAQELLRDCEDALLLLESTPDDAKLLNRIFRCAHTLKGTGAMLGFDALAEFAHDLESLLARLRDGALAVDRGAIDTLLAGIDVLRAHVAEIGGGPSVDAASRADVIARLRAAVLGESKPAPVAVETPTPVTAPLREPVAAPARVAAPPAAPRGGGGEESATSIRVPIEKVDRLVNLVGELVTTQSSISLMMSEFTPARLEELQEAVAQMDRYCREMQERVLGVRMLPVKSVFAKFQRVVRDLAASTGKRVELRIAGEETELDKTVIEKIGDPLTHLVRNAIDHGIEGPDERRASGKPETATLSLSAYQKGGSIFIEVAEDGRGLNRPRILETARRKGIVDADAGLTDAQIDALIFAPGFSTAPAVTDLSGRGVGMDVVLRNVTALKGGITIHTERGVGTRFQIKLPLTLAILDGLALRVGAQVLVVPLVAVIESVVPRAGQARAVAGGPEVADVRGEYIPVVRARQVFRVHDDDDRDADGGILVVIDAGSGRVALRVDEVVGQYQVVQKSLEQHYRRVPGIAGATILGDGRVALILDPSALPHLARGGVSRRTEATDGHGTRYDLAS